MEDQDFDEEEGQAPESFLEETEIPCTECGTEEGCHLYDSHTVDLETQELDPQISLCGDCGPAHEAFYEAVREEEAEKEAAKDEQKNAA